MLISFSASLFSNIFQSTPISANEEERKNQVVGRKAVSVWVDELLRYRT